MRKKSCGRSFIMSICKVQVCQRRCCKSAQFSQLVQRQLFTSLPSLWHPSALNRIGLVARRGPSQKWKLMSLNIWQSDNKETIKNCKHKPKNTNKNHMMCSACLGVWRSWRNESAKSTCDCEMLLFEVMWRLMEDWFFTSVSRSCLEDRQSLDKSAVSVSVGSFPFAILSKRTSCNNVESLQWNKNIQSISIKAFKEFARPPSLKRLPLFPKGPKWWTLVATAFESIAWYARAKLVHIYSQDGSTSNLLMTLLVTFAKLATQRVSTAHCATIAVRHLGSFGYLGDLSDLPSVQNLGTMIYSRIIPK